jgi:hypothetical protein
MQTAPEIGNACLFVGGLLLSQTFRHRGFPAIVRSKGIYLIW